MCYENSCLLIKCWVNFFLWDRKLGTQHVHIGRIVLIKRTLWRWRTNSVNWFLIIMSKLYILFILGSQRVIVIANAQNNMWNSILYNEWGIVLVLHLQPTHVFTSWPIASVSSFCRWGHGNIMVHSLYKIEFYILFFATWLQSSVVNKI